MWSEGETILRREVLNDGRAWFELPVVVVRDEPDLLATFIPEGAPFRFPPGPWPRPGGLHPWHARAAWQGHGVLMLQRPGELHAIWHFWEGPERRFAGWYVNIQEAFRRTSDGYDTQDLELDIVVSPEGRWKWKDVERFERGVRDGWFTKAQGADVRAEGARIAAELDAGRRWWDDDWSRWAPDPAWTTPVLP